MGTNYYLRVQEGDKCKKCGRGETYKELHIGKSSYGWAFNFDSNHDCYKSFKDWRVALEKHPDHIYTEYDNNVTLYAFYKMIADKKDDTKDEHSDMDSEGYRISKYSDFS